MKCEKCGSIISDDSKFCPKCGINLESMKEPYKDQAKERLSSKDPIMPDNQNKPNKKILLIAGVAVVILLVLLVILLNKKTIINLNNYVTVQAEGYNGFGNVYADIDFVALNEQYSDVLKPNSNSANGLNISDLLYCYPDKYDIDSLSNGDEVTIIVKCDEEIIDKNFKCKFECSDFTYTVSGLKEPKYVNPFDELDVFFIGTAPHGTVAYGLSDKDYMSLIDFNFSQTENLSNNDIITVNVDFAWGYDEKDLLDSYGIVLQERKKTYTVSGLAEYIRDTSSIDTATFEKMKELGEEYVTNYNEYLSKDISTPTGVSYLGSLVAVPNDDTKYGNRVYLVYQVDRNYKFDWIYGDSKHTGTYNEDRFFFTYVYYENVIKNEDGIVDIDPNKYETCKNSISIDCRYNTHYHDLRGEEIIDRKSQNVMGFETYEELWIKAHDDMNGGEMYACD